MKAIILLSGGLDSSVLLAMALEKGRECYAISFDYNQRHKIELKAAKAIANFYSVHHQIININCPGFSNSSLVSAISVPKDRTPQQMINSGIPSTYVPARNTIFLAYAVSQAEALNAQEIYFGPNALDFDCYPDCRPGFIQAFQAVLNSATKQSLTDAAPQLITPLMEWNKVEIIHEGKRLGAPLHLSFSCYDPLPDETPCRRCDSCVLRQNAFKDEA